MRQIQNIILFRVDSSTDIGSGHVARCVVFANKLRQNKFNCIFICRDLDGNFCELIRSNGFRVFLLPAKPSSNTDKNKMLQEILHGCDWEADAAETIGLITTFKPHWLIVDHYSIDYRWETEIKKHCENIFVIDDLADKAHNCKVLLNQNLGHSFQTYQHLVSPACTLLIGPKYSLLSPKYRIVRESCKTRVLPVKSVLVYFGASDKYHLTQKTVETITEQFSKLTIKVVLPRGCIQYDTIKSMKNTNIKLLSNLPDLTSCIKEADVSIGASGSTSWERCCLGLPTLLVSYAENQIGIAKTLEMAGACVYVCHHKTGDETKAKLLNRINTLIYDPIRFCAMSRSSFDLVDGLGTERVFQKFKELTR